ncbi:glycosyltransferase family 4 protein [Aromatoleum anaerobium]|uniref:Glycosyltransferase n=1 Tax=Aromatoleum anaerobium TaxID=182180 RepID=A0ABX1PM20_9RHOO|nr:glycosyltransferase family 4 protein [Aromatoleum anaerobium]MCK0505741.1 glycosyltransferase family 4 protein [Aromatoleum anaerobium]
MRVLWVVNTIFPDAAIHLGMEPPVYGGWMYGLASDLAASDDVQLSVATIYAGKELQSFSLYGIHYCLIPKKRGSGRLKDSWREIIAHFAPDLVHIHGTEFGHGMALMNACPDLKYVVSIQGLVSVYHRYFMAGMTSWDVLRNITFRDVVRRSTLFHARHDFYKRGLVEQEYIRRATAVIGRTDWDRAHTRAINPKVRYHFCNESLRDEFYTGEKWSLDNCRRHSIFLSQAGYPIKGLHQVLKAVALLKEDYPDILVEVAGQDITKAMTLMDRFKRTGYGSYISSVIKHYGLTNHVKFLGPLHSEAIKAAYLRAHVFISPSSIENSSNSIGEAQILGTPVIASYVGGVMAILKNYHFAKTYEFLSYEVLASYISSIFESTDCRLLAMDAQNAQERHDRKINCTRQIEIYSKIIKGKLK